MFFLEDVFHSSSLTQGVLCLAFGLTVTVFVILIGKLITALAHPHFTVKLEKSRNRIEA